MISVFILIKLHTGITKWKTADYKILKLYKYYKIIEVFSNMDY